MTTKRSPLRLPSIATGLRSAWHSGYGLTDLRQDILAGLTIGTVAVPLSMALAIAAGVAPQHGLYTAIIAGAVIAIMGGSRVNVSGPTAAFVVILLPIVQQYGLGGLLIATMMAGAILVLLGLTHMGRLIQFVPYPVVLGFTAGIAVVIAVLQVPDFLGLEVGHLSEHFVENVGHILSTLTTLNPHELSIGVFSLVVMLLWPRLHLPIPAPLVGLVIGALAAHVLDLTFGGDTQGPLVETIASRFSWEAAGSSGTGIPPIAPTLVAPWQLPGADGQPLTVDFALIRALMGPAIAIAMLGAIESLLCSVVSDGLTRTRHDPDAELIGQGLGNLVAPLFAGITATAAIARTATNIRCGARSPLAAVVHSAVVLLAVIALADLLGKVPMATLSALLFIVAWNMSEARHFLHSLRSAPRSDVAILLICFGLTVLFNMVLAVAVGVGLAAALFIRRMMQLTQTRQITDTQKVEALRQTLGEGSDSSAIALYDIDGPLFFGVADKALTALRLVDDRVRVVILDMSDVPSMDGTAIVALKSLIDDMHHQRVALVLTGLSSQLIVKLRRAGIRTRRHELTWCRSLPRAVAVAHRWLDEH